jgi:hypothetical protein
MVSAALIKFDTLSISAKPFIEITLLGVQVQ